MTEEKAKLILHAYRPDGSDATDPEIVAALNYARTRPELMAWFEDQHRRDSAIARKLKRAAVPEGLLDALLVTPPLATVRPRSAAWPALALAASIAFLLVGGLWWFQSHPSPVDYTSLRKEMAEFLVEFPKLDIQAERLEEIRAWLTVQPAWAEAELPAALRPFPGIGCRSIPWHGHNLGLVCFNVQGEVVHLMLMPATIPGTPASQQPEFARVGQWNTAQWRQGDLAYLVITRGTLALQMVQRG